MFALLFVLIAVPIVELAVMVQVAGVIGVLPTVALVVGMCFAGAWLMKVEGIGVLRRLQTQLAEGQTPANEVVNGVLILIGGLLMLVPGFVTGILGLLLLLPPVRALLRPVVLTRAKRRIDAGRTPFVVFSGGFGAAPGGAGRSSAFGGRVYDADSHLDRRGPGDAPGSGAPPSPPPELGA